MKTLGKGLLAQRRRELAVYARVLPSLDLKRLQLGALAAEEHRRRAALESRAAAALDAAANRLPMAGATGLPLHELCRRAPAAPAIERLLGVPVPVLAVPQWQNAPRGLLTLPPWADEATAALRELIELRDEAELRRQRALALEAAIQKTLQRINLFERVLMPRARTEIRTVQIALADAERTALVRAKQGRTMLQRHRAAIGQLLGSAE